MPHFIAECTANIKQEAKLDELFAKVNDCLASTGVFPLGGIRSRAIFLDTYRMADGAHDYAFVHMTLKIGSGRDLETRKAAGEKLFAVITDHLQNCNQSVCLLSPLKCKSSILCSISRRTTYTHSLKHSNHRSSRISSCSDTQFFISLRRARYTRTNLARV